ncbi:dUTP diphosphatase [Paenibacillus sp. EPM92]|uniref:dUTP diphosphatase n=1 Tax=Paenibacillus sp. EPM92 TaxID=1561195 RepID=UPI001915F6CD|nr:dUTP diphosphatase [Paenibacillus sp. EPM92]
MLTLEDMYEKQKELDARIIKEKGHEGVDLLPNTVLALQVEIAELANEWRGFKHWSNRQKPRMYPLDRCDYCGEDVEYTRPSPFMADASSSMCKQCWDMTKEEYAASNDEHIPDFEDYPHFPKKVPQKMLEEYVDCLQSSSRSRGSSTCQQMTYIAGMM